MWWESRDVTSVLMEGVVRISWDGMNWEGRRRIRMVVCC